MAGMRDRNRHIGLGLIAKIDRAEPDAVGLGFDKARVAGEVGAARHCIGRGARQFELLLAGAVDLGYFGNCGFLAQ